MTAVYTANHYSFTYENTSNRALDDISFTIHEGEIILLTGNSGSGKSTLLNSFNGLIPNLITGEVEGSIKLYDLDLMKASMFEISNRVGSVFQNPRSQFFTSNTTTELVFSMENFGCSKEEMEDSLCRRCKQYNLTGLLNRDIFSLSSGERQLLALACARSLDEHILLFDEPSANLDYGHAMKLGRLIHRMKDDGFTIIIADHRFFYLNNIIDRVFLMEDGKLQIFNTQEEFMTSPYPTRSFELFRQRFTPSEIERGSPLYRVSNLSYKNILKDINCTFYEHEICALIGANGAGKSTLAKLLCGSIKKYEGDTGIKELPFYIAQDADYQLFGTSVFDELLLTRADADKEVLMSILKKWNLTTS